MLTSLQKRIAKRFRMLLCANDTGEPPWLGAVAEGEGPGFFMPDEAPWVVHANLGTLVGGVRALLMQALHPGSLAGVRDHSRYKDDPLGRLAGTIQWLTVTTFASREYILREAQRVRGMHKRVQGTYRDARGEEQPYDAFNKDLLLWVHIAFTDSFLRAHQAYSHIPIPGGADAYINLWAKSVEPLGLEEAPRDEVSLLKEIERFEDDLVVTEDTREVIHWIRRPPLPFVAGMVYRLLFQAAYVTLSERHREMIGLRTLPGWVIRPLTRIMLRVLRFAIGTEDPLQHAALERLDRWKAA